MRQEPNQRKCYLRIAGCAGKRRRQRPAIQLQEGSGADHRGRGCGLQGSGSGFRRRVRLSGHHALLHGKPRLHRRVAQQDQLFVHLSTQNVSGVSTEYAQALNIPASNVRIHQDHVGGGFGSKFGTDRWGIYTAQVSKKAGGKPVRVMLERDSGTGTCGCAAFGVCACKSRREKRWHVAGLGI